MSSVKAPCRALKTQLYRAIGQVVGQRLTRVHEKEIARRLPPPLFSPDGRLFAAFLPHVAPSILELFPASGKTADELIAGLRAAELIEDGLDLSSVVAAVRQERDTVLRLARSHQALRHVNARLFALQELINKLGNDAEANRKVATRCLREGLGFSGVRVYTVDLAKGTWFHRFSEGEEGTSRFVAPAVPEANSEKSYLAKLMIGEIDLAEVDRAVAAGSFQRYFNGEWGYLYIPDRSACDFVDKAQLARDEGGDPAQARKGYGSGSAREILYLVFGKRGDQRQEVYMVTNWASHRPLFTEQKRDLELLRTFAISMARARELAAAYQRVEDLSITDELTGVYNKRYFNLKLESELARADRLNHPLSLLMFDIDKFKLVNDTHGHPAGDEVLRMVAQAAGKALRTRIDVIARYGGEEFAIILPEINGGAVSARDIGERVRAAIEQLTIMHEGQRIPVTISVGAATFPAHAGTAGELIFKADQALYRAKDNGRNRVEVA